MSCEAFSLACSVWKSDSLSDLHFHYTCGKTWQPLHVKYDKQPSWASKALYWYALCRFWCRKCFRFLHMDLTSDLKSAGLNMHGGRSHSWNAGPFSVDVCYHWSELFSSYNSNRLTVPPTWIHWWVNFRLYCTFTKWEACGSYFHSLSVLFA